VISYCKVKVRQPFNSPGLSRRAVLDRSAFHFRIQVTRIKCERCIRPSMHARSGHVVSGNGGGGAYHTPLMVGHAMPALEWRAHLDVVKYSSSFVFRCHHPTTLLFCWRQFIWVFQHVYFAEFTDSSKRTIGPMCIFRKQNDI